jgi:hypothetical protein
MSEVVAEGVVAGEDAMVKEGDEKSKIKPKAEDGIDDQLGLLIWFLQNKTVITM